MNLNIWELVKRLYRCFVLKRQMNKVLDGEKETIKRHFDDIVVYGETTFPVNYIRVKKGDRRYVLRFTDTTKQVPEWVRKKNLGRLTKKEMACIS